MSRLFKYTLGLIFFSIFQYSFGQTCFFTSDVSYDKDKNLSDHYNCIDGATSPENASTIYVNPGVTLTIETTGSPKTIEWDATVIVQGSLVLEHQLVLGDNSSGCAFNLTIEEGGTLQSGNGNSIDEQLIICGNLVIDNKGDGIWTWGELDNPITGPVVVDDTGGTLPVELISFAAQAVEQGVILRWSTASELNNDYFTLERSRNGKDFEYVRTVQGNGTVHTQIDYSYTDHDPYLGLSYYRLTQTDYDGTSETFPTINILFTSESSLSVYPNPVLGQDLKIRSTGYLKNEILQLVIYNLQGEKIAHFEKSADVFGNLESELQLNRDWQKGVFILEVSSAKGKEFLKLKKE